LSVPITKALIEAIRRKETLAYAKDPDGALYVASGHFIVCLAEQDISRIADLVNRNRTKNRIEPREAGFILDMVNNVKGNFELIQPPYVLESGDHVTHLYTDGKQYFHYDKQLLDMFQSPDLSLFIDDHTDYSASGHNLVIKGEDGTVLGIVAPLCVDERLYEHLVHALPLDQPRKSVIEFIRENPTGDPYIGREFFDGRDTYIIAAIRIRDGAAFYEAPTVRDGALSRNARLIPVAEIEKVIERWEANRVSSAQEQERAAIKAQEEAAARTEYEHTHGYADRMPPLRKANVLKTLDAPLHTKDYGALSAKEFIEAAIKDGKTVKCRDIPGKTRPEYRLMLDDSRFYRISKTAYEYGKYLSESGVLGRKAESITKTLAAYKRVADAQPTTTTHSTPSTEAR